MLTVATTEIFNVVAMDQLRAMLGAQIEIKTQLAAEAQLEDYIDQFYGYELSVDGILKEIETGEIDYESVEAGGDEYTQPMVRLVNALLVDAVKRGASDIHFEPDTRSCACAFASTACSRRCGVSTRPTCRASRCASRSSPT